MSANSRLGHGNNSSVNGQPGETKPDIVIVGGSLGGLFAGVALKVHGYNTTILERTDAFLLDNQGAGIVAGGDTLEFFRRYDRSGVPVAVPSHKRLYLDQQGHVIHEEANRQNMTSWDLCYYLLRANYDRVDSAYLAGGRRPEVRDTDGRVDYRYGCLVTAVEEVDGGERVRVVFRRKRGSGGGGGGGGSGRAEEEKQQHQGGVDEEVEESVTAALVVAADGPSSTLRSLLEPDVKREYAGYVVIRGTVPEGEASQAALDVFRERFCFFHAPGIQNLTYTIAGENGTTEPGQRLLNFVWYANFPDTEPALEKLMTDKNGRRRHITIPPGMIAWDAWEMLKSKADERLPPQMAEMAHKTRTPFVQCITDVISPKNVYKNGKLVLVGDALAGFRPHTVASTSQAAFDVMSLVDWLDGKIDRQQFVLQTMEYARLVQHRGVKMGNRSQFETLPVEEYIKDRNLASTKRADDVYPEWTRAGLEDS